MKTPKSDMRQRIEKIAFGLGAKPDTVRKWFERRSVPAVWQIRISAASKARIRFSDFEKVTSKDAAQ